MSGSSHPGQFRELATGTKTSGASVLTSSPVPRTQRGRAPRSVALFGREQELARLRHAWEQACDERSTSVLVVGEPGIGKTSLVRHFAAQGSHAHTLTLVVGGVNGADAPPLWPWIELVRRLRELCPTDLRTDSPVVAAFAPWLESQVGVPTPPASPSVKPTRFLLIDSLVQLVVGLGNKRPVRLIMDDLHEFERDGLAVAHELLRRAQDASLMLVGTCRSAAFFCADEDLAAVLTGFDNQLRLSGLSCADVAALMESRLSQRVRAPLARRVHRRSRGNPLYVRAITSALATSSLLPQTCVEIDDIVLPDSLRRAGMRQLAGLSPACRRVLEAAAVLGREFDVWLLAAVARWRTPAEIDELLDEAARAGVVDGDLRGRGRYRFTHALLHEWLSEAMQPDARRSAHARAGSSLMRDRGFAAHQLYAAAFHFRQADDVESLQLAAQLAERAGSAARERGAESASVESFKLCVSALRRLLVLSQGSGADQPSAANLQSAASVAQQRALCARLLDFADAQGRTGQSRAALSGLLEAAEHAVALQDAELLVQAAIIGLEERALVLSTEQQALCDMARPRLSQVSGALRARLLARLATYHCAGGLELSVGRALIIQGRQAQGADVDSQAELALREAEAVACDPNAPPEERRVTIERYRSAAATHGDLLALAWAEYMLLHCAIEMADAEALANHERSFARAVRGLGGRMQWLRETLNLALFFLRGQFEEARHLLSALSPDEHHSGSTYRILYSTVSFGLTRRTEEPSRILASIARLQRPELQIPAVIAVLAATYCDLGEHVKARQELARALPLSGQTIYGLCQLAHVARELQEAALAAELYAALAPLERRFAVSHLGLISSGCVAHFVGLAAYGCRRAPAAVAHLQDAIEANRALGALPALACSHHELARILLELERCDEAATHASAAHELATKLGMRLLSGAVRRVLAAAHDAQSAIAMRTSEPSAPSVSLNEWRRCGERWTLGFDGKAVHLTDRKGLEYLAKLLECPGRAVHVTELISLAAPVTTKIGPEDGLSTRRSIEGYDRTLSGASFGQYRQRMAELEHELQEAREQSDLGRCEQLQNEREFLLQELSDNRRVRSRPVERARKAVYNRIREAVRYIRQFHVGLASHLEVSIRTGVYCSYSPEHEVSWML